jgi:putative hydroxymethylpyrimidine transport system substrate-binding protein
VSATGAVARVLAFAALAGAVAGCGTKRETLALPAAPAHVVVSLDGPPGAAAAPIYAAIGAGDFTRGGLAVSVVAQPGAALAGLAAGTADLAVASEPALLRARDRGAQLVAVGALVQTPLDAIVSVAPHPIARAGQLDGTTVAVPSTPIAAAELDTILRTAGVAPASVHRREPGADPVAALVGKRAGAVLGDRSLDPASLRLAHRAASVVKVEDAGVPGYNGLVLVVRVDEAHHRGPILRTFLQALSAGARATLAAPAAAAAQLAAANPGLRRRLATIALDAILPALTPTRAGSPYGFADPRAWSTFGKWMLAQGLLTRPDDAALAVTDEFLPGQGE